MKKFLVTLMALVLLVGSVSVSALAESGVTLTFWNGFTGDDGSILVDLINRFNKENTQGITVNMEIMTWDSFNEKLPVAIATKTAPDFVLINSDSYGSYYGQGLLRSTEDYWKFDGVDKSDYMQSVLDLFTKDNTLYEIPMNSYCRYLYWNKDLFTAAGLDPETPPKTVDELYEDAIKLTNKDKGTYGLVMPSDYMPLYVNWMYANGGSIIDEATKTSTLNSESNLEVLKKVADLFTKGVSPLNTTGSEFDNIFKTGTLAMCVNGPWMKAGIESAGINYGVTTFPAGSSKSRGMVDACGFAIPTSTSDDKLNAIYSVIKWWNTTDIAVEWSQKAGFAPYLYSVAKNDTIKANAFLGAVADATELSQPIMAGFELSSRIYSEAYAPMIQALMNGGDPAAELKKADEAITSILSE